MLDFLHIISKNPNKSSKKDLIIQGEKFTPIVNQHNAKKIVADIYEEEKNILLKEREQIDQKLK